MNKLKFSLPLIIFLILAIVFYRGLFLHPQQLSSTLINKPVPAFQGLTLNHHTIDQTRFIGKISLINVWASWCTSCHVEHPVLLELARTQHLPIYGINYKDDAEKARGFLQNYGNPYATVVADPRGTIAIDFGVYGTPETFLVDPHGIIRDKFIGPITWEVWQNQLSPEINLLRNKQ